MRLSNIHILTKDLKEMKFVSYQKNFPYYYLNEVLILTNFFSRMFFWPVTFFWFILYNQGDLITYSLLVTGTNLSIDLLKGLLLQFLLGLAPQCPLPENYKKSKNTVTKHVNVQ